MFPVSRLLLFPTSYFDNLLWIVQIIDLQWLLLITIPVKHVCTVDTTRQYKWRRNEVDDELASMSGTGDLSQPQQEVKVQPSQSTERGARHSSPVPSTSGSSIAMVTKVDHGKNVRK